MTLVDTSVWIDFFRGARGADTVSSLLENDEALVHPWVIGELALGHLGPRRAAIIDDLGRLAAAPLVGDDEVLAMVDARSLAGSGIGWVDAQLLASALVAGCGLWTRDRKLAAVCRAIGLC